MKSKSVLRIIRASVGLLVMSAAPLVSAMDLEEFLTLVKAKNQIFQAFDRSREAAQYRKDQGDAQLATMLTAKIGSLDDQKKSLMGPGIYMTRNKVTDYSLGVAKKFSSGTAAQFSVAATDLNMYMSTSSAAMVSESASLGISLSQSLWKDSFGAATRLRRERESVIEKVELRVTDLQMNQVIIEAEAAFWDYQYLKNELLQRKSSLERAQKIESWVRTRVLNGIGDRADLLNAQGLVAMRELQLLQTQDDVVAATKKIRTLLEMTEADNLPELEGDIANTRALRQMIESRGEGRVVRMDTYLLSLEAKAKAIGAQEADDGMKPDLVLSAQYKTNSFDAQSLQNAVDRISETNTPTSAIALNLTWMIDGQSKQAVRGAAKAEALAAEIKKNRMLLESDTAWSEIQRRHQELSKKIRAAETMANIQQQKARAERDKLSKGRTVTSQVIQAEQDAAEADLTLIKMRAEQRKIEAQSRLFLQLDGVL